MIAAQPFSIEFLGTIHIDLRSTGIRKRINRFSLVDSVLWMAAKMAE
ncbi:Uncharacterised protein [Legionella sainthelensi]|nr:Uncharacterised protein [Legionella sainthelensi]